MARQQVVIVGGGAALAQPLIEHFLSTPEFEVTALCRNSGPVTDLPRKIRVIRGLDASLTNCWEEKVKAITKVDVLVTLTGSVMNRRIQEMDSHHWRQVVDDNLTTVFNSIKFLAPKIIGGNIVVVGSVVGSTGGYGCANYAAAKAGLVGLVRAAANEYAKDGICINLLELGYINAGMGDRLGAVKERVISTIPLKRFGSVQDFVLAVDFLSRTRYCTGNILTLAGGLR